MAENNFKASLKNAKTIVVDQTQPGVKAKVNPSTSTLLPAYLQTNTNKKLLDTSLDLVSRSGSLEQVQGYSYDSESIPESAHENQIRSGMDDVTVFATNGSSSYNYREFLSALNSQNFDIQNKLPSNLDHLPYHLITNNMKDSYDTVFVFDCGNPSRLGKYEEVILKASNIIIAPPL